MVPDDDLQSVLRPTWLAVAALIFARLDSPRRKAGAAELPAPGDLLGQTQALTAPADLSPQEREDLLDDIAGLEDGLSDMFPARPHTPPPRLRLALLRLCAALGDVSHLTGLAKPAALTVIEGVPADIFDSFAAVLRDDILPLAIRLHDRKRKRGQKAAAPVVLAPVLSRGDVSDTERKSFDTTVLRFLEGRGPMVVVLPFGMALSPSLLACAPVRIVLPALDRAMLMRFWTGAEPRMTKLHVGQIVGLLPSDDRLAVLNDAALLAALRLGDPREAAKAISARCARPASPRLDDLPDTPAKQAAVDLIAGLTAWRDGKAGWDEVSHSLLLSGPPGTGKSYIAQAMASVPGIRFVCGSFAEWQACGHLGDLLKAMHNTFAKARSAAPAILFIDEIDSAGSRFSDDRHNKGYARQVINAFLMAIDTLNREGGVLLVGACNDRAALDPAILRPGRFDRHVDVPMPDRNALSAVLRAGLGDILSCDDVDWLSRRATGQSLAAVDSLIRRAKLAARLAGRKVTLADVEAALPPAQTSPALDWRVAVHEAGHAVVGHDITPGSVTRISIAGGGGTTERILPPSELLEEDFHGHLSVLLAGRAAERLILGSVSGGAGGSAHSDLAQATALATAMETQLGLGSMGPVWLAAAATMDPQLLQRVRARLDAAEAHATTILSHRLAALHETATALNAERELSGSRLENMLACQEDQAHVGNALVM